MGALMDPMTLPFLLTAQITLRHFAVDLILDACCMNH